MKYPLSVRFGFTLLSIILAFYGIIQAKDFLYPIAFATLLAYLLFPAVNFLEKKGFPRILSIIIVEFTTIIMVYYASTFVYHLLLNFVNDFPKFKVQAGQNIDFLTHQFETIFNLRDQQVSDYLKESVRLFFEAGNHNFNKVFQATAGTLVTIGLMPVFVFMFLYYRTKFAIFILKIVPKNAKFRVLKALKEISLVATNYMGGVLMVVLILCILNSFGLYVIGMKYALTLGILSALFNFIPYFGTLMGAVIPLGFSVLISASPFMPLRVIVLFVIIQFLENNILTPNIVGGNLRINALFIILSLIMGAMVWGIPGMIVVVPFLAIVKIIFKHSKTLEPYSYLISNSGTRKHAITTEKVIALIQKKKRSN
jgi:predicted PurR-regulated permease PerM